MGFFKNIFRRKSSGDSSGSPTGAAAAAATQSATGAVAETTSAAVAQHASNANATNTRRGRRAAKKQSKSAAATTSEKGRTAASDSPSTREDSPTQLISDDPPVEFGSSGGFVPNSTAATMLGNLKGNNSTSSSATIGSLVRIPSSRGPDLSDGTQRAILSPRIVGNTTVSTTPVSSSGNVLATDGKGHSHISTPVLVLPSSPKSTPVDLDDESFDEKKTDDGNTDNLATESGGSQTNNISATAPKVDAVEAPSSPIPSSGGPIFAMADTGSSTLVMQQPKLRFSAGNVSVEDDTDGESSSFNLSTDAEDTEYEAMRRRLGAIMPPSQSQQQQLLAMDMSVTNYTTDGETSVFQGLPSEDDATMTTASVTKEASSTSILHLPTNHPATGASLVPVGSGSSNPYTGFPMVGSLSDNRFSKQHSQQPAKQTQQQSQSTEKPARFALPDDSRFVMQQQKLATKEATEESSSNINNRFKPQPTLEEMRFALPDESRVSKTDEIRYSKPLPLENAKNLFDAFSSPPVEDIGDGKIELPRRGSSFLPSLSLPKKDSPERKRSPKASRQTLSSTTTANNFPQYNSNFLEAIYGSPAAEKPVQPQRRSFSSLAKPQQPSLPLETTSAAAATFEPFASEPQPFDASTPFASSSAKADEDLFAGFADFSTFDNVFSSTLQPPTSDSPPMDVDRNTSREHDDMHHRSSRTGSSGSSQQRGAVPSTSTGAIHNETSLSELLAQAKSKSSRSGSHSKKTSTSVNSAPAMTASYLRQHHNLGKARTKNDGTSVTDIIHSLEAANASRAATDSSSRSLGGSRHSRTHSRDDAMSAHSRDGGASVPSTKEKHRRRRERRHHRSGAGDHSSESDDDYEDNESWLVDEITGTLGPRGIAADLESLSGRSNRSSSSRGNRSHKSHRSHKSGSRTSSRRRKTTGSGDSVDSRHSRDSRRSRGSRYSHRSTRSYISQMSEQSRSVANDLLRLEMQLAMVGSGGVPGTNNSAVAGGGSASDDRSMGGGRSRVARTAVASTSVTPGSSSRRPATARRSRITVHAPPGKLGIILANKADSRGTVVSGVRTSSVLAETISPGDRIVAIDGEDVSLMTVSEITTIMARNAEFDRTLTVLTTPRHTETVTSGNVNHVSVGGGGGGGGGSLGSPRSTGDSYQQRYSSYRN